MLLFCVCERRKTVVKKDNFYFIFTREVEKKLPGLKSKKEELKNKQTNSGLPF